MAVEPVLLASHLSITSPQNQLLKRIRRAVNKGTQLDDGLCVAESFHLVREARRSGCRIATIVHTESGRDAAREFVDLTEAQIVSIPDALFREIATTEASQGILALVQPPVWGWKDVFRDPACVFILDGLQDPGNAGAILRAGEAFGVGGVVALRGTVNLYNPKAVRASAGSIFRLPVIIGVEVDMLLREIQERNVRLFAAMPRADQELDDFEYREACGFVIGSEGQGVRSALVGDSIPVRIPTEAVESLNAGIAAAVIAYEVRRQRTSGCRVGTS